MNVNVALGCASGPLGPPLMSVSGGVLSTITTRLTVAGLPARSEALTVSVCLPSGTSPVRHDAVATPAGAGSDGRTAAPSAWPAAFRHRVARRLPASAASTRTSIVPRTKAPADGD